MPLERPVRRVLARPVRTLLRARAWGVRVQIVVAVELRVVVVVVVVRFTAAARASGWFRSVVFISVFFSPCLSSQ